MTPRIILLNGVGSVGKSTTARALQSVTAAPFLHVTMDAFLDMLPTGLIGHPDGLVFAMRDDQGHPSIAIHSGPVLERAMRGMRHAVAAMAAQGNDLIVDEVMVSADKMRDYRALLTPFSLHVVGLFAPLEVLEARAAPGGDREIGLARWQFDRVHRGMNDDLRRDTMTAHAAGKRLQHPRRLRALIAIGCTGSPLQQLMPMARTRPVTGLRRRR